MNPFKKPYGLDHPTWDQPTCFYHDTYDEAKASAVRTYGDSAHIVIGPVDEWKARAEAAERKVGRAREDLVDFARKTSLHRGSLVRDLYDRLTAALADEETP